MAPPTAPSAPAAGTPPPPPPPADATRPDDGPRSAEELFASLERLGAFRIIHQAGPSTFEAIAPIVASTVVGPFLNLIGDDYHWHLRLSGLGHAQTFDGTHARSGRRVLYLALADRAPAEGGHVFTRLYVHRAKDADFDPAVLAGFMTLHATLAAGRALMAPPSSSNSKMESES